MTTTGPETRSGNDCNVDGLGRIVIPAEIREHFGLHVGDHLDIHIDGDAIVLTPNAYKEYR